MSSFFEGVKGNGRIAWIKYAIHLRILILKFKSQTTKLERLLIMLYQPMQNDRPGDKGGNNPADKVLEMIHSGIQDLLVDGRSVIC